jgi:hypothetical protein
MIRRVDVSVAHPARIYNYWLGGKDNFAADRQAGDEVIAVMPMIAETARANRVFLTSVVHFLAAEAGIRQFLDIGTGLPTADNTHEVAQRAAPESRVVYVDNDQIVLSHARALLTSSPEGVCTYVDADARDADQVLDEAAATLDLTRPIAVMMLGLLQFIPDSDDPWGLVRRYLDATVPGSYLAISHISSDVGVSDLVAGVRSFNARSTTPVLRRTRAEFTRFFDGLEQIPPGVVPLGQWTPGATAGSTTVFAAYTALGRKP